VSALLPLAVGLPVLAAGVSAALRGRLGLQRAITAITLAGLLATGTALVVATAPGRVLVERIGGWPAPFAITFAADPFAALMLTAALVTVVASVWFAAAAGQDRHPLFHPLVLVLAAGTANAFLTADLFNLFVAFEVMLIASYVLLVLPAAMSHVRAGAVYVTTNLVASALFVIGVALVYGLTGTVNFAVLSVDVEVRPALAVPGAVLLVAFSVKAALVPVHGWLARTYPATLPATTALFSGLLTKVGVYALYRVYTLLLADVPGMTTAALVVAGVSMAVGVLGAVGRDALREILAFHMTSQMGYMLMGLGLFGVGGLTAGILFTLHQIIVKTSLFLSAGAVERLAGTGSLRRLGGLARGHPVLATAFALSALSLAGLPPLSGFFGKFLLVEAALSTGGYVIAAVAIVVSLYTLTSMVKIWDGAFWGETVATAPVSPGWGVAVIAGASEDVPPSPQPLSRVGLAGLVAPGLALAVISLLLGFGAEWFYELCRTAGEMLADKSTYVDAVLGR
jgi:multicomponent Na+:H+ antiporter subunit D